MKETDREYNLIDILGSLPQVKEEAEVNFYALRYEHRSKKQNFAISLPSNQNENFLSRFCKTLETYKEYACVRYDPVESKAGTYEFLPLERVALVWTEMSALLEDSNGMKQSLCKGSFSQLNLTICELKYKGSIYWFGTQQKKEESLFKDKYPFMNEEGKLNPVEVDKLLTISFQIDFIIQEDNGIHVIYVLNRGRFEKVFNFYELLREHVQANSDIISQWDFLENASFIQSKITTGYVFKGLARIIDNKEYIKQIKNTAPHTLKCRLLEKCAGSFSEEDFVGDKLKVTPSNLGNIIKMLSKGFRYNFFSDKAEEW